MPIFISYIIIGEDQSNNIYVCVIQPWSYSAIKYSSIEDNLTFEALSKRIAGFEANRVKRKENPFSKTDLGWTVG